MQEEKSWVYTMILGVCMLLCLLLLGRMLLGHAEQQSGRDGDDTGIQKEAQMGIPITDETLCALLTQVLPVQTTQLTAHISADHTITVSAQVERQALQNSSLVPGNLRTALLFSARSMQHFCMLDDFCGRRDTGAAMPRSDAG